MENLNKNLINLLSIVFLSMLSSVIAAQCLPAATPVCDNAPQVPCFPFEGATPEAINNGGNIPGCGGTALYSHTTWYSIEILSNDIGISILPSCEQNIGIHAGLYADCDPNSPTLALQCACTPTAINFSASGLTPGFYYLMIDACQLDQCDFEIIITTGQVNEPGIGTPEPIVPNPPVFCEGDIVEFSIPPVSGATDYIWDYSNGIIPVEIDCNTISVIWGTTTGTIAVNPIGNCGSAPGVVLTTEAIPVITTLENGTYCEGSPGYFYPGDGQYYTEGAYEIIFTSSSGCDSIVVLEVFSEPTPITTQYHLLCPGESVEINGVLYFAPLSTIITIPGGGPNGCDSIIILELELFDGPFVDFVITDANCGSCNGEIDITIYGGTGSASYSWSNGATTEDISGLCPGTYYLEIYDYCVVSYSFVVEEEGGSNLEVQTTAENPNCGGECSGSIELAIDCGTPPYIVDWSEDIYDGQTSISDLCAGSYQVTITDSLGVAVADTITLTEPAELLLAGDTEDAVCNGEPSGAIFTSVSGGTAPYSYDWSVNAYDGQSVLFGIVAGYYELTLTDNNGCQQYSDFVIEQPTPLEVEAIGTNVTCNTLGAAIAIASGATSPYQYQWNNNETTMTISDLVEGTYVVTVTDNNGCTESDWVVIESDCCQMEISIEGMDVPCLTNGGGSAEVVFETEGTAPYNFEWSNSTLPETQMVDSLRVGTYIVTVTDASGCTAVDSIQINRECCPSFFHVEVENESCLGINDGTASLVIDQLPNPPYLIEWSDPDLPSEDYVDMLAPGTYTVTLTNADGCSAVDTFQIKAYLDITLTLTPADCDGTGGTAMATAGGFFIYYNWSNGGTGSFQRDLSVGQYTVRAWSIFGGCQSERTFQIERDSSCDDTIEEDLFNEENTLTERFVNNNQTIKQKSALSHIKLYPNPISDKGFVEWNGKGAQPESLMIFDSQGRLIQEVDLQEGTFKTEINLSTAPSGLFYLKYTNAEGVSEILKWIKM